MTTTPSTDNSFSIAAREFIWTDSENATAHKYLIPPTVEALRRFGARTVLDLGCGNGACSAFLQSQGFSIEGCDSSASGLELARLAYPKIRFFEYDVAQSFPAEYSASYDSVVALEVVEHLLQPRQLLIAAHAALRPGGMLILSTPYHGYLKNIALALTNSFDNHWHPLRDFGHVKFFSRKTLTALVEEGRFSVSKFLRVGRIPAFACSMIVVATSKTLPDHAV